MSKKIFFRKPQLHNYNEDLSRKWYVAFSCPDPSRGGDMRRKKIYKGLHKIKDVEKRNAAGKELCQVLLEKLMDGYNPWVNDENVAYIDELDYVYISEREGKKALDFKSFNYYASSHIAWVEKNLAKKTLQTYRSKCRIFRDWLIKNDYNRYNVTAINNEVIVNFFEWLIETRNTHKNTLEKYQQILRTVLEKAVKDNPGYKNPVYNLPNARNIRSGKPKAFVKRDLIAIIEYCKSHYPQLYLFETFLFNCGLRPGQEVRLMKVGWIDFNRGTITVPAENNLKAKKSKTVTIPPALLDVLVSRYHIHHYPDNYYVFGKHSGGTPGEMHWSENHFPNLFIKVREILGLPSTYKLYGAKHAGAAQAIDDNVSLRSLSSQLGHSSIDITSEYVDTHIDTVNDDYIKKFKALT